MKNQNVLTYRINRVDPNQGAWWKGAEEAAVNNFPWAADFPYRPCTSARVGTDGSSLFVRMETDETNIRMETKGLGRVHTDSCMEFFVSPDSDSAKYLNYEFNPAGGMHLAVGTGRHGRELAEPENYRELFQVKTTVFETGWSLEFRVPLAFLRRFFSVDLEPGRSMRGNFYKCGDETARPHFGCWSPVDLPAPDFHCPDFFGTLTLA